MIAKTRVEKGKKRGIANPVLIVPLCREHNLDEFCFATPLLSYGPFWVTSVREHTKSAEIQLCLWLSIISCKLSHYIYSRERENSGLEAKAEPNPLHLLFSGARHIGTRCHKFDATERDFDTSTTPCDPKNRPAGQFSDFSKPNAVERLSLYNCQAHRFFFLEGKSAAQLTT